MRTVQDFAGRIAAGDTRPQYVPAWNPRGNPNVWQTYANVVWQDVTSNATYCSAAQALSAKHG